MNTEGSAAIKKTCGMCRMEIPADARKCPYCQHFQNRATLVFYHPVTAVVLAMVPLLAMLGFMVVMMEKLFNRGENFEPYQGQIAVADTKLVFGEGKSGPTVAVLGELRNFSAIPWKEVAIHVEFADAAGKRVDVGQKSQYDFRLPAKDSTSFKVSFAREFPETNYVKHVVRIVAAKDARAPW
jgi:hypothetical protein